jgi:short-subunit dehydrogenase
MQRIGDTTVAIVTGASSGIGEATARAFAARGATVVAVARRRERLDALARVCSDGPGAVVVRAGDLADRSFAEAVVEETAEGGGRLDVLVNNAATTKHKHALHASADEAERVLRINTLSPIWTTTAALPVMLRQPEGGTIVNVSSFAAEVVPAREGLYAASKAALNAYTAGLWNDLDGTGVHAGLVIPGAIDTGIWEKTDETSAYAGKRHPTRIVVDGIFAVIEKRRFQVTTPRLDAGMIAARWLRLLAPALLRLGVKRLEPTPPALVEAARERARRGLRLGDGID